MNSQQRPSRRSLVLISAIALSAFVAIWGGWVGLGGMTSFGPIRLLPGIVDQFIVNSAITLPLGLEAYAALALRYFLAPLPWMDRTARRFAGWSALASLLLGAGGQIAYHLMAAEGLTKAPWQITAAVSCLPVVVLGFAAALVHLVYRGRPETVEDTADDDPPAVRPAPPADEPEPPAALDEQPGADDDGEWTPADELARLRAGGGSGDPEADGREAERLERLVRRGLPDRASVVDGNDLGAIVADLRAGYGRPVPPGGEVPRCSRDDIAAMYRTTNRQVDKFYRGFAWRVPDRADERAEPGEVSARP